MYKRDGGGRSAVVCGGISRGIHIIASCEELPIDASDLPAASSWRPFASLPYALFGGCMLQVNSKVRLCSVPFFE